jgi:transposase
MAEVEGWLEEGRNHQGEPVHWTLARLQGEIVKRFGVQIGITALWKRVRALAFRQKVPRPHHRLADPEQQEAFKKKSLRLPRPT